MKLENIVKQVIEEGNSFNNLNSTEAEFMQAVAKVIGKKLGKNPSKEAVAKVMPQAMKFVMDEMSKFTKTKEFKSKVLDALKSGK